MKKKVLILTLLLIATGLFWHCSEEIHDNAVTFGVKHKKPQIKYLKGAEAKLVMNQLEKKVSKSKLRILGKAGTFARSNEGTIDYSEIMQVIDTLGNTNYTFRIINHPDDTEQLFHNLVYSQLDEEIKLILVKYENFDQNYQFSAATTFTTYNLISDDPCPENPIPISGGGGSGGAFDPGIPNPGSGGGGGSNTNNPNEAPGCWDTLLIRCCQGNPHHGNNPNCTCPEGSRGATILYNTCDSTISPTFIFGKNTNIDPCNPDGDFGVLYPDEDCNTTPEDLKNAFPNLSQEKAEQLCNLINENGHKFGINNKFKLRHFLSQIAHESGGLNNFQRSENLNYSSAGLLKTFPKYFSTTNPELPNPINYANNPQLIANYVYSNRMGNGNIQSGDGYKYRGRGLIQITGKDNYTSFSNFYNSNYESTINFVDNPDLIISNDDISIISAMWFFSHNVISKTQLKNNIDETVLEVTKKINGGKKGFNDRTNKHNNCVTYIDCK